MNITNGVIIRGGKQQPPQGTPSCTTTLFSNDNCSANYGDNATDQQYPIPFSLDMPVIDSIVRFAPKSILVQELS